MLVEKGKGTVLRVVSSPAMGRLLPRWGGHVTHMVLFVLLVWFSWLLCSVVAALVGARKNAARSAFAAGMLLGPLGILVALMMKRDPETRPLCEEDGFSDTCHRTARKSS
ncbi:MAG TPA: hypothetical protein VLX12_07565 [Syntrophorhabdales bacterium]|nr:hypothetical protein [Syntrophorhabdales bacterium]